MLLIRSFREIAEVGGVPGPLFQGGSHAPAPARRAVRSCRSAPSRSRRGAPCPWCELRAERLGRIRGANTRAGLIASGQPPGIGEAEMVAEGDGHSNLGDGGSQVHPAPSCPLFIGALEGLVAAGDGEFENVALGRGDLRVCSRERCEDETSVAPATRPLSWGRPAPTSAMSRSATEADSRTGKRTTPPTLLPSGSRNSLPSAVLDRIESERASILRLARQRGRSLTPSENLHLKSLSTVRIEEYLDSGAGSCALRRDEVVFGTGRDTDVV